MKKFRFLYLLSSEPMLSCIYSTGDYGRYRITSCGSSLRHWPPGTNNKPFVPSFFSEPPPRLPDRFPPESAQVAFLQEGCARFPGRAAGSLQSPSTPLRRAAMQMGSKSPDNVRQPSIGSAGGLHASIAWKGRSRTDTRRLWRIPTRCSSCVPGESAFQGQRTSASEFGVE
jgi:hypothetical protein